jgi:uncharacterized membrane protein YdbT with pleckstrin-like domain
MTEKMKAGELRVEVEQEDVLWYDRKRITIFALPWSFTKYTLTESKITLEKGLFNTTEEEVKLYRITDIAYSQSFWERIGKTGTIRLLSNDRSSPELVLEHVKNARTIKDVISKTVDEARRKGNVKTSEMVGNVDFDNDGHCDHDGDGHCDHEA